MDQIFWFTNSVRRDSAIELWINAQQGELGLIARHWCEVMRELGDDVRELMHDGHPTFCVENAAFAYINAFNAHVNVGFFRGSELDDPARLLDGTGKHMRHVKLRPESEVERSALIELIEAAYKDMQQRSMAG